MNNTFVFIAFSGSGTQVIGVFDTLERAAASFSQTSDNLKPFIVPKGAEYAWYESGSCYSICKYKIKTYGEEQ